MVKITFMGAGSSVFARNVLGDCMLSDVLSGSTFALYDIDAVRLADSKKIVEAINRYAGGKATIEAYLGVENRKAALQGANYVVNAIQVGLYKPCTVIDFDVPKRYGLKQTIGDTLGIGGIFRALRTIPIMLDFASDMEEVCPDAWFLNYTNPMVPLTGAMLRRSGVKTIGLCHSVQACAPHLLAGLDMPWEDTIQTKIAGINHMAWLLSITQNGVDLYPEIKKRALNRTEKHGDMVRYEMMKRFGFYVTESSEHNAEYLPYFIKDKYPELIERFNIPINEYPRRCEEQIVKWAKLREELTREVALPHTRSNEYASHIIEAMETNRPCKIGGNVLNTGLIDNLPQNCVVEVPCLVDASGIAPTTIGHLPEQLAALNRTNINVQMMIQEAAQTLSKDALYQAAFLDPHTASELSMDDIVKMCDDLIDAHGDWLPQYR